jgi:hypothetical protein
MAYGTPRVGKLTYSTEKGLKPVEELKAALDRIEQHALAEDAKSRNPKPQLVKDLALVAKSLIIAIVRHSPPRD